MSNVLVVTVQALLKDFREKRGNPSFPTALSLLRRELHVMSVACALVDRPCVCTDVCVHKAMCVYTQTHGFLCLVRFFPKIILSQTHFSTSCFFSLNHVSWRSLCVHTRSTASCFSGCRICYLNVLFEANTLLHIHLGTPVQGS